jgi:hypothetical protein
VGDASWVATCELLLSFCSLIARQTINSRYMETTGVITRSQIQDELVVSNRELPFAHPGE